MNDRTIVILIALMFITLYFLASPLIRFLYT